MKILEINNTPKTNFTALRIPKANAEQNLSNLGKKMLERLDSAGEIIKDTKFYHLYVDSDIFIRRIDGAKYVGPYTLQSAGKILLIGHKCGYQKQNIKLAYDSTTKVEQVKADIISSETQIERTAKIVKYLDDYEKEITESKNIEKINNADVTNEKIRKLINKYGV